MNDIDRTEVTNAREELMARVESELSDVPHTFGESGSRPETREKYGSDPKRLDPAKWGTLTFNPENQEQADRVWNLAMQLKSSGYSFDTGGGCGGIDWELDWSFQRRTFSNKMKEGAA